MNEVDGQYSFWTEGNGFCLTATGTHRLQATTGPPRRRGCWSLRRFQSPQFRSPAGPRTRQRDPRPSRRRSQLLARSAYQNHPSCEYSRESKYEKPLAGVAVKRRRLAGLTERKTANKKNSQAEEGNNQSQTRMCDWLEIQPIRKQLPRNGTNQMCKRPCIRVPWPATCCQRCATYPQ